MLPPAAPCPHCAKRAMIDWWGPIFDEAYGSGDHDLLASARLAVSAVTVESEVLGAIGPGLMALVGVGPDDTAAIATTMAGKACDLRIFRDDEGRTNRSLVDTGGARLREATAAVIEMITTPTT